MVKWMWRGSECQDMDAIMYRSDNTNEGQRKHEAWRGRHEACDWRQWHLDQSMAVLMIENWRDIKPLHKAMAARERQSGGATVCARHPAIHTARRKSIFIIWVGCRCIMCSLPEAHGIQQTCEQRRLCHTRHILLSFSQNATFRLPKRHFSGTNSPFTTAKSLFGNTQRQWRDTKTRHAGWPRRHKPPQTPHLGVTAHTCKSV